MSSSGRQLSRSVRCEAIVVEVVVVVTHLSSMLKKAMMKHLISVAETAVAS